MPLLARLFQHLIGTHRAFAAGTAHSKFHGHNGQTQNDQEQQVKQYKGTAAALTCHIRKFPHVANADGTACRQQDEAQPRFQRFTFHNKFVPSNNFSRPPSARKTGEISLLYHKLEENGVLFSRFFQKPNLKSRCPALSGRSTPVSGFCMGDFQERKHCFVRRTQSFAACAASKLQNCFQSHAVISWGPSRRA